MLLVALFAFWENAPDRLLLGEEAYVFVRCLSVMCCVTIKSVSATAGIADWVLARMAHVVSWHFCTRLLAQDSRDLFQ